MERLRGAGSGAHPTRSEPWAHLKVVVGLPPQEADNSYYVNWLNNLVVLLGGVKGKINAEGNLPRLARMALGQSTRTRRSPYR